jgi:hypothetical protein
MTKRINLLVNNVDMLTKINCYTCQKPFTDKDIKERNYQFTVNYDNITCFNTKEEHNKLEKKGERYFLSLEVIRIEHEH